MALSAETMEATSMRSPWLVNPAPGAAAMMRFAPADMAFFSFYPHKYRVTLDATTYTQPNGFYQPGQETKWEQHEGLQYAWSDSLENKNIRLS